jgi:hypothetical protein
MWKGKLEMENNYDFKRITEIDPIKVEIIGKDYIPITVETTISLQVMAVLGKVLSH